MRSVVLVSLIFSVASAPAAATDASALKVAIAYNIIRFIQLPPQSSQRLVMCVSANDDTSRAFQHLDGKVVPNGRLLVRTVSGRDEIRSACALAYIEGDVTSTVPSAPAVTIGDGDGFIDHGGMIRLRRFGRQIAFEVNIRSAKRKGVQFSARLLNLASAVHER